MSNKVVIWFESLLGRGHIPIVDEISKALIKNGSQVFILTTSSWRAPEINYGGAELIDYSNNGHLKIL